jgi:hypothetical protein
MIARKIFKKMKNIFLFFPFQTIFLYEGAFSVRERWTTHSLGLRWGFKTISMFISLLCIVDPAGNNAIYRLYLPKYKFGNHRAIPGNSMTKIKPTIIKIQRKYLNRHTVFLFNKLQIL